MKRSEQLLSGLSALKLTSLAREMRGRAAPVLQADPIAIVGMACRVPGASSPGEFWTLLKEKRDATTEIPGNRWDVDKWYDPEISTPGKSITRRGGFIDQIDHFDADYFGILAREADAMDPQQRIFLECAVEALDDAGQRVQDLRGSRTGVFVASYHSDYQTLAYRDISAVDLRTLTGSVHSVVPNRLSHFLDLRGPSISIDTACSSSLVALHTACQSLRLGESDLALSGGISLMITPDLMVSLSKVGFMAPDGRSKAFDKSADGFGRGEGCGVLALKRMSDAIADGDRIHAIIRGSAVNQDGESTLLTAPNGPAQEALISEALEAAQVSPQSISFVEAHGTGTELGDPIEVEAIASTIGHDEDGTDPCYLGTCKANLGHLEAAAGVVGVIKSVLVLVNGEIPGQPCFETLSPHISLDGTRLIIPRETTPLRLDTPLRAGVSGFGVGGTNAHVVLENAPDLVGLTSSDTRGNDPVILPLTGQSPESLTTSLNAWAAFLGETHESLQDISFTAAQRRTHHSYRLAVHGKTKAELTEKLVQASRYGSIPETVPKGKLAFVFCGQGAQWVGMGRELAESSPAFLQALELCEATLQPHWQHSLLEEIHRPEETSRLAQTEIAQPVLFAVQFALAEMWKARGIEPQAVVGHSVGEIAALTVAGALDLDTAARIVCHRARLMQRADGSGAMASVDLSAEVAKEFLPIAPDDLSIAAMNAPETCVFSGTVDAVSKLETTLVKRGIAMHRLPVRYAFHNAQMDALLPELRTELADVRGAEPRMAAYSTVTGDRLASPVGVEHFCDNVRQPVRFAEAVATMSQDGIDCFLEIGPHPVLAAAIHASTASDQSTSIATLRRGQPEGDTVAAATASLFGCAVTPDWNAFQPEGRVVSLPPYAWNHQRHWLPQSQTQKAADQVQASIHPLLSGRQHIASQAIDVFDGNLDGAWDWLSEHRVFGQVLMPGTAILEALIAAASAVFGPAIEILDFAIGAPLVLDPKSETKWQISVQRKPDGGSSLKWHSWDGQCWRETATAETTATSTTFARELHKDWSGASHQPEGQNYTRSGLDLGPAFQRLRDVTTTERTGTALLADGDGPEGFSISPFILDAGFQLASVVVDGCIDNPELAAFLPVGVKTFRVSGSDTRPKSVEVRLGNRSANAFSADISFFDSTGAACAQIDGAEFLRADNNGSLSQLQVGSYREIWELAPELPEVNQADDNWLIVNLGGDRTQLAIIADLLTTSEGKVTLACFDSSETAGVGGLLNLDPTDENAIHSFLEPLRTTPGGLAHIILCCGSGQWDTAPGGCTGVRQPEGVIAVLNLTKAVLSALPDAPPRITIVTRGAVAAAAHDLGNPDCASITGLMSTLALEHPELRPRVIDLELLGDADLPVAELLADAPRLVARRGADRLRPRLVRSGHDALDHVRLERTGENTAVSVALGPIPPHTLAEGQVRLAMRASGVNFRDVLSALGMYPGAPVPLGAEGVGEVSEIGPGVSGFEVGQRVMGLIPWAHGTEAVAPASVLVPVPDNLSDARAAATPVAFLTAAYGLYELASLKEGSTILIHAAAGGVGMAAVKLARKIGATIFATAGSDRKRKYLREMGITNVFSSRDLTFAAQIRDLTGNRGVDVVLNSLADDFITESLKLTTAGGVFLELGKRDILSQQDAQGMRPDVRYHAFDLGEEALKNTGLVQRLIGPVLDGFADGSLEPLPVHNFALTEAAAAFRHMAQARHLGKIVLSNSHPDFEIDPDASYWITGGTGAIGLDAAHWLIGGGARKIVLSSRSGANKNIPEIENLRETGADIVVINADAADRGAMTEALGQAQKLGPLKGVVHAAGSLRDAAFTRQTAQDVSEVFGGKVAGAHILDELTLNLELDFFLTFSGAGLVLGSPGQSVYSAANAALDALMRRRRARGLPATCMSLGPWDGAGMSEELRQAGRDPWADRGVLPIKPENGFAEAERLITSGCPWSMVANIDWQRFTSTAPSNLDRDYFDTFVAPDAGKTAGPRRSAESAKSTIDALRSIPPRDRYNALLGLLTDLAKSTIGLTPTTVVPPQSALKDVGLDSLMAVEFRNTLVRVGGRPLPVTLLFDHPTLDRLVSRLAGIWELEIVPASPEHVSAPASETSDLADISDEEALALLQAELDGRAPK
ncbi:SDR family NAD(P)-dependent oxidoreductase [Ruegeria sp. 2012CJ41-6]|uniref:SDR family NAD(P)-dependent oxidoreductase n=1 Tax=Ruegeria spongiae TaxID=2942209 RepID=A0ABT0Q5M0_9RHOB|nr:type I polyketide synthase [Ruegeria spongiae]MCL6285138.1 SDR family NAD(P)-dependent oxidoreductase [Ruegeria spongiae]